MTDAETRFIEIIRTLDDNSLATAELMIHAAMRGDMDGCRSLAELLARPERKSFSDAEFNFDLLDRLKALCPYSEYLAWCRTMVLCAERGDHARAEALQDLMRRRVAN
ncbi:MAG: hypothetical protein KDK26_15770 [Roseivivax sp.]|nr:hypothetical protein [Roseivivax sp.]